MNSHQKIASKGGKARADKLSKERRVEISKMGNKARWKDHVSTNKRRRVENVE